MQEFFEENEKKYRYSLLNRFVSLIIIMFIILMFGIGWKLQRQHKKYFEHYLSFTSNNIETNFKNSFYCIEQELNFLAELIARNQGDSEKISELLNLFSKTTSHDNNFSLKWVYIGWSDKNHSYIANPKVGFIKSPINLMKYFSVNNIFTKDFSIKFGKSDVTNLSNSSIMPVAISVKDKNNEFLGMLTIGVDLNDLNNRIQSLIEWDDKVYYALFNNIEKEMAIRSSNFNSQNHIQIDVIKDFIENKENKEIYSGKDGYYTLSKFNKFPFTMVIGMNDKIYSYKDDLISLVKKNQEIFLMLFLMILGFISLFYILFFSPFLKLAKAAEVISGGDFSTKIPDINSKEGYVVAAALEKIKILFRTEKELVRELSEAHNALSITNLRLENKVAERTIKLEQALSAKTDFLNNISHEIKTPLQAISSISENALNRWLELSEQRKFELTKQVMENSRKLLLLVSSLLDLSKFEAGKMILNITKVDIVALIFSIIEESKMLYIRNKNININFFPSDQITIMADQEKISQLLRNLFVNAIKFSPNNSSIGVKLSTSEIKNKRGKKYEAIHFMLHDQGVGVEEKELEIIFSPFFQGSLTSYQAFEGAGLGLTICREIINAHNGKIWAVNNKDGGATFNFIIPIEQPNIINSNPIYRIAKDLHEIQPNILIIDDEETCLDSMELLLHGSKYNLIKASSGQMGLKYLKAHAESISLIFLDLMIPDIYGLNLLSEIKKHAILSKIPVILQTGTSDEAEVRKAFKMGVAGFIRKPYTKDIIFKEIERALHD